MKLVILALVLLSSAWAQTQAPAPAAKSTTVPVTLDHNRVIIDVRFPLADGTMKRVRAWVDNGTPDMWITEDLAKKLSLPISESKEGQEPKGRTVPPPPAIVIGGMTIRAADVKEVKVTDRDAVGPGMSAEINLPSTVLRNYDVSVDYLNREFSIAAPGSLPFKGTSAKVTINPQNGLVQVPAKIAGGSYNLALDLGASFSLVSADLLEKWQRANPQWPHMIGAVGPANMWGSNEEPREALLRIPSIEYGPVTLSQIALGAFPAQWMDWYQKRAGVATIGELGGNALLNYRVGIDYAHSTVYFDQTSKRRPPELEVVGLTLRPEKDGKYTVIGVTDYEGKFSVPDAMVGDTLVAIDKTPAKGGTMGQVWSLLGGSPGDVRTLTLERDGKSITAQAPVRQFLK